MGVGASLTGGERPRHTELGDIVGRGMSWGLGSTLWTHVASFGAQVALGYLLSDGDFGIYAIALSLGSLLMALQHGGAYELLVQRGPDGFESSRGPVLWMACAFNVCIAGALAAIAPLAVNFYGDADIAPVLWVLSLSVILSTPTLFLRTQLRIELRFVELARLRMLSAVVRFGGAVAFAFSGLGPLSFVLPLPAVAIVEFLILRPVVAGPLWRYPASLRRWPGLLKEVKWLMVGTLATALMTMGDYLVLGRAVSPAVVGIYFFAFQLTVQITMLAAANVNTVLMPTLSRLGGEPVRQRLATLRSLRALVLAAVPMSMGLAVTIAPLESMIWGGIWEEAVSPVRILCLMMPLRVTFIIASVSLKARGRFRTWAMLALGQGVGLVAAAGIAGVLRGDATTIALVIGAYYSLVSPLALWISLRAIGVTGRQLVGSMMPVWSVGTSVTGGCIALDWLLDPRLPPPARFVIMGSTFVVAFGAAGRATFPSVIADTLSVLPQPIKGLGYQLFRLNTS